MKALVKSISGAPVPFSELCDGDVPRNSIDKLLNNPTFLKSIAAKNLYCGQPTNSDDVDSFASRRLRFVPIYKAGEHELNDPVYVMIQHHMDDVWGKVRVFSVGDNFDKFYQKLSSRTITLKKKGKEYIYHTNNSGNNWWLKNTQNKNATFKMMLTSDEIKALRKDGADMTVTD